MTLIRSFAALFIMSFIAIGCHPLKANFNRLNIEFDIEDYGAVPNDGIDDSKAFVEILKKISGKSGDYTILIPAGNFYIDKQIEAANLEGSLSFKGKKGSVMHVRGYGFAFIRASSFPVELIKSANRHDATLEISNSGSGKIENGDLIHIETNSVFETGWKYREHDIHRIKKFQHNRVDLHSTILFNYKPDAEKVSGVVYKKFHLSFSDIEFRLSSETPQKAQPARRTVITAWGVSLDMKDTRFVYNGKEDYYHLGLSVLASEGLKFSNIYMKGFMYGILMNFCRNIQGKNTFAEYTRHAYTPAQATINVDVENLRGEHCHSVMDAHQAFNVHYKNVVDTLATQFPNCRSLGTFIEDASIYLAKTAYQDYAYWSVQTLTKEYEPIYKEYDTRFLRVNYVVPRASAFNGLTSFSCRNFIVEDCTTSSIAYYGDQNILQKVKISDSRVGVIRIDGQKTEVTNTVLDGRLFPEANYVFRFTGSGETHLNGVRVQNYDPSRTFLFDMFYNQPAMNKMVISNSSIGKLRGFANKLVYPGMKYDNIEFKASTIENFKERVNAEFPKVSRHIINSDRN